MFSECSRSFFAGLFALIFSNLNLASLAAEQVDLELVLAVDVSGSVSSDLAFKQQTAFAAAFRDPTLQRAILSGPTQKVAVIYFEYSGLDNQRVVLPWTVLSNVKNIIRFADMLDANSSIRTGGETSISGALLFAQKRLMQSDFRSHRKVIDITGNGRNNEGPPVNQAIQGLQALDVVVNGLVLPETGLDSNDPYAAIFTRSRLTLYDYFETEVISGPGAFAIQVDPKVGYVDAILRKLVLEVAWVDKKGD